MKRFLVLTFIASMLFMGDSSATDELGSKVFIDVSVFESPTNTSENSAIVARPKLITAENQECRVSIGSAATIADGSKESKVIPGLEIVCKPGSVNGDTIFVDVTVSKSDSVIEGNTRKIQTRSTRKTFKVKLGEVVRVNLPRSENKKQTWIEMTFDRYLPA